MISRLVPAAAFFLGTLAASGQLIVPGFDAARTGYTQTGEADMDDGEGSFSVSRFQLFSALSRPISPADGWFVVPFFDYRFTDLNIDDAPADYPIDDEDLHSLTLSSFIVSMRENSRWIHMGWVRAELATDFEHVNDDDFTFDLAAGSGYRFNEKFTLGAGASVMNLNGDVKVYPGINFDWIVNDQFRLGLYGPSFIAAWSPTEEWLVSFREDPLGGVWNVAGENGESRAIDYTSFRLGLYLSRRLTGNLWITAGGGAVVGNQLDYTTTGGDELVERDADATFFGSIGLRLKAW